MKPINTKCIVCGSDSFKKVFPTKDRMFGKKGRFTLCECNTCKLAFLNPQPTAQKLKQYYVGNKYYAYQSSSKNIYSMIKKYLLKYYYSPTFFSRLLNSLLRNVPAIPKKKSYLIEGKIMDIGCGSGETLQLLKGLGWDAYGIESNSYAVSVASKNNLKNVKLGTYELLKFYKKNFFDAIRLYHVLEHIDDPKLCLKLIHQKLKKQGELIIGVPNYDSFHRRVFRSYWYNLDSPRHLYLFSVNTLKKLLEKEHFIINKIDYHSVYGVTGSMRNILEEKFGKSNTLLKSVFFGMAMTILFYPIERFLDVLHQGDIIIVRASTKI
ncbi:class I SAM-dependent methyltransferase [Candidatus Gottesmanbacteria bacterium]|nr:class I SAM-dependent methyltransferase [Candidatus Gottesmanbacteria bacterium]